MLFFPSRCLLWMAVWCLSFFKKNKNFIFSVRSWHGSDFIDLPSLVRAVAMRFSAAKAKTSRRNEMKNYEANHFYKKKKRFSQIIFLERVEDGNFLYEISRLIETLCEEHILHVLSWLGKHIFWIPLEALEKYFPRPQIYFVKFNFLLNQQTFRWQKLLMWLYWVNIAIVYDFKWFIAITFIRQTRSL